MVDVMVMKEIEATATRVGVDLSSIDLDSIRLPTGDDLGIVRYLYFLHKEGLIFLFCAWDTCQYVGMNKKKTKLDDCFGIFIQKSNDSS